VRRLTIAVAVLLTLVLGAYVGRRAWYERAWQERRGQLLDMALFPGTLRRPWEIRLQGLHERVRTSPRMTEITASPHRPVVTIGDGPPRKLTAAERVWVESLWNELVGLDGVLTQLRSLELDELAWHGESMRSSVAREMTTALCASAWLALEEDDDAGALACWADALRLARATDDGTTLSLITRATSERTVLGAVRAALGFGLSPLAALTELAPLLADWEYTGERAEQRIRRDLASLADTLEGEDELGDPGHALAHCRPVEAALSLASEPAATFVARGLRDGPERQWTVAMQQLHARHAERNVALTALAVAAFREEHGALPASLADLPPRAAELALDPLTGEPLPYARTETGARVGPAAWGTRVDRWSDEERSPYAWRVR
jgi:hypothetical protein